MLAERAIRGVLVEYCRGVDRGNPARVMTCYHPGAVDRHGTWEGEAHRALPAALATLTARTTSTVHFLGASSFDWDDSGVRVETSVLAVHQVATDDRRTLEYLHGRYLDVFTQRDGAWRIAARTFVHDLDHEFRGAPPAYPAGVFTPGGRGELDPTAAPW